MVNNFIGRLQHAWNAFKNRDPTGHQYEYGLSYGSRPDRMRMRFGNERSIVSSIYTRIGIDVAAVSIQHIRLDENGRYAETINSNLNECLTVQANIDQSGRALIQDIAMSMFDEGVVAVVPVDTTLNPNESGSFDIQSLRVGKILEWYPRHVRVQLYNDRVGRREEVILRRNCGYY